MLKIDKGVAPPLGVKVVRTTLKSMEVGDSFLVANATVGECALLSRETTKHTNKFISRAEESGMRVWRIE